MFRTYLFLLLFSCSVMSNSMDCSMLGFPDLHNLPEFAQTHVHWVDDAIQPYHPLPPPSPLALNLSQHQSLFQWVDFLHQVAKVLELQLQLSISPSSEYSGLISFRIEWLDILAVQGTLKSLLQLKSIDLLARSLLYGSTLTSVHDYWKNHSFDYLDLCPQSDVSDF